MRIKWKYTLVEGCQRFYRNGGQRQYFLGTGRARLAVWSRMHIVCMCLRAWLAFTTDSMLLLIDMLSTYQHMHQQDQSAMTCELC